MSWLCKAWRRAVYNAPIFPDPSVIEINIHVDLPKLDLEYMDSQFFNAFSYSWDSSKRVQHVPRS